MYMESKVRWEIYVIQPNILLCWDFFHSFLRTQLTEACQMLSQLLMDIKSVREKRYQIWRNVQTSSLRFWLPVALKVAFLCWSPHGCIIPMTPVKVLGWYLWFLRPFKNSSSKTITWHKMQGTCTETCAHCILLTSSFCESETAGTYHVIVHSRTRGMLIMIATKSLWEI